MTKNTAKLMAAVVLILAGVVDVSTSLDLFTPNPSPTFEIYPNTDTNDSSLIWFEHNNQTTYDSYVTTLKNLIQGYNRSEKVEICDKQKSSKGIPCDIDMKDFGPCGLDPEFGYYRTSPCIFLKIKLNNLKLQYYNYTESPPAEMPEELKEYFRSIKNEEEAKKLYISCEGADVASKEHIGPVRYYPTNRISDKFLHNDAKDYVDPIIAMQLVRIPKLRILIDIECRMWAKNIDPQKNILQFGVLVD